MRIFPAAVLLALAAGSAGLTAGCASPADKDFQLTPEERHVLRPIPEAPEKVRRMVEHGDELFVQATAAYRRADPDSGGNWETKNAMAHDLYTRARESYIAAQAESGLKVPPPILERSRESLVRLVALQKWKRGQR